MSVADERLLEISERQHGLVTRCQVRDVGLSDDGWWHRLRGGGWDRITNRVARRRGAPPSTEQRVLAAVLDVGPSAYVSHWSAAALWGIPNVDVEPVDVIVVRGGRQVRSTLARTHRPRHLPDPFGTVLDGIPVVRPALVVLQVAPMVSPERLRRLLDQFWARRLLSGPSLANELDPLLHRGRPGTVAVRSLLAALPADYVPPASGLEGRFATIMEQAGLPAMRRQVDLGGEGSWSGRVDFLDVEVPLVVEVDSERHHASLTDASADRARQSLLEAAGFTVLRFGETDIWRRPTHVVDRVREVRAALRTDRSNLARASSAAPSAGAGPFPRRDRPAA